ncbi:MAG: hypothetical protein ABMB14_01450 [Myxococcota bacterium]
MTPPVRALIGFVLGIATPLAVLVLLWASDFFMGWDGHVVSVRAPRSPDASTRTALIVDGDRAFERDWPASLSLDVPVDPMGIPPVHVADTAPETRKARFTLHFLLEAPTGFTVVPTTSPRAVAVAFVVWLVAIAIRNMAVGGLPWAIVPRAGYLPTALPPSGQAASSGGTARRPKKGPPPGRPSVGRGRR